MNAQNLLHVEENAFMNTHPRKIFLRDAAISSLGQKDNSDQALPATPIGEPRANARHKVSSSLCASTGKRHGVWGKGFLTALLDIGIHILVDLESLWNTFLINK